MYDNFDNSSYNYAAIDEKGKIIGSIRIILDNSYGLPIYKYHRMNNFQNGRFFAEINRLVVDPTYKNSYLGPLLMKAGHTCATQHGATCIAIGSRPDIQSLYLKMGFEKVSDKSFSSDVPKIYWIAMILDCIAAQKDWPTTRPRLYRFFTTPDKRIEHRE